MEKLIDLSSKIPKQLDMNFYHFSMICYIFLNFTSSNRKVQFTFTVRPSETCTGDPRNNLVLAMWSLAEGARGNPAGFRRSCSPAVKGGDRGEPLGVVGRARGGRG